MRGKELNNIINNLLIIKIEDKLKPYLKLLPNYKIFNKKDIILGHIYIKYVPIENTSDKDNENTNYLDHIKSGGILIKVGNFIDTKFKECKMTEKYEYMQLKYNDNQTKKDKYFYIKCDKNYIFYRQLHKQSNRTLFENILISLNK